MRRRHRLHVPGEYTLFALGYRWDQVRVVPNGCLSHVPSDRWVSASTTPGSVVCVPLYDPILNRGTWFPLRTRGTDKFEAWGREIRIIDLRGWLGDIGADCNPVDPDWPYDLYLDAGWAVQA